MAALHSIKAKLISLAAVMLICVHSVFATVQTVAVLPSEGVLNPNELEFLTDKAQEIAVRALPRGSFEVFPRDVIIKRLGGVENYLKECMEASCIVDLGKKAQVDYIAQCRFGKLGSDFTVAFELYKVSSSALVDKFAEDTKDFSGLRAIMEKRIPEGFAKILEPLPEAKTAPPEPVPFVVPEPAVAPAAKKKCKSTFNINELVSQIESGFTAQLKDCSATLAKNMALAASPFGKKAAQPEPRAFMMECTIDGMKQKLAAGAAGYIEPIESFVQNILSAASASGGGLDVKKLSSVIGDMDVNYLISELKDMAFNDECAKDEPYTPSVAYESERGGEDEEDDDGRKVFSLGLRTGFNFSHLYAEYDYGSGGGSYNSTPGFQLGMVFDWALTDWFHIQPGLMYIQKGAEDGVGRIKSFHYIETPLLLSLKFSALRLNAGPYLGICFSGSCDGVDIGLSTGLGFDIGMFYIGMFYDFGLWESYYYNSGYVSAYNRTLGFNFGVNL